MRHNSVILTEFQALLPHNLMANRDPGSGQDLVHMPQAQEKAEVEPDRVANDLGREAVAGIAGVGGYHHSPGYATLSTLANRQPEGAVIRPRLPLLSPPICPQ